MPIPLAGGSNITVSARFRTTPNAAPSTAPGGLNLGPPPGSGGAIVKVTPQSQALIPRAKPSLPAYEPPPFAEPPRPPQQIYLTQQPTLNPRPVPNLNEIAKPIPNLPETPFTTPKNAPVVAVPNKSGILQIVPPRGGVTNALVTVAAEVLIHDAKELVKLYKLSQPESKPIPQEVPFTGGQETGVKYTASVYADVKTTNSDDFYPNEYIGGSAVWGPIDDFYVEQNPTENNLVVVARGLASENISPVAIPVIIGKAGGGETVSRPENLRLVITRLDNQPDTSGNAPPLKTPTRSPIPLRQASPQAADSPGGLPQFLPPPEPRRKLDLAPNLAPLPADKPLESNKRIPITITTPGAAPITITTPGAAPVTISPSGSPATIKITRPAPAPTTTANPTTKPTTPAAVPIAVSSPNAPPTNLVMPGGAPITITMPGQKPIIFNPSTGKPTGVTSSSPSKPSAFLPIPITPTQTPTNPVTTPTTPGTPTTTPDNPFADIKDPDVAKIGLGLVGITQLLQGLNTNTTPTAISNAVCETTKPNGCTTNAINKGVSAGNEDLKQFLTKQLPNIIGDTANLALGADTNARVKNIENRTGSHRYPITLPEYLLDDFIDKPIIIQDQVDFNVWLVKNVDALVGLFPIKIERTDENGVKQMLKYENIAEAIAEITGLLAEIAFDADTSVNVGVHATSEAIGAKIAAIQANSYLKAISDYLGYQGSHKSIDVPISCTPGAVGLDDKLQENELGDFLKSSTQRAIGWECTERDDLHSIIKRILFDSEIARAALYKPLKPPKPGVDQPVTGDAIKADRRKEKDKENDEWEKFKTRIKNQEGTGVDIDINEKSLTDETP